MIIDLDLGAKKFQPLDLTVVKSGKNISLIKNFEPDQTEFTQPEFVADLTKQLGSSNLFTNRNNFPAVYDPDKKQLEIVRFIELQGKTEFSLLDSVVRVNDLINKVPVSVGVNEHGNMYSLSKFGVGMYKAGKKALIGAELYMFSLPRHYFVQRGDTISLVSQLKHESVKNIIKDNPKLSDLNPDKDVIKEKTIVLTQAAEANTLPLLAKNKNGYMTLKKLVSKAQVNKEFTGGSPQLTWDYLRDNHDDVLALSGSEDSEFYRSILSGDIKHAKTTAEELKKIFGDDFYIEVFDKGTDFTDAVNQAKTIAKELGIKTVACDDFHMLNKDQKDEVKAAQSIKLQKTIKQNFFELPGDNYYVHTSEEAENEFKDDLESLDNTIEVYNKIENYDVLPHRYFEPAFILPKGYKTQNEYFEFLVHKGFKVRMKQLGIKEGTEKYQKYVDRLNFEIGVVRKMKYAGYFIVVADYVNYARRNYEAYDDETVARWKKFIRDHGYNEKVPIAVGYGRGSAAGSLVCYSMFITDVDPMPYDLLFERFLNPDRVSMPDVDFDSAATGRPEILKYVSNFYNHGDNVDWMDSRFAGIIVFGSLKGKQALRDTTRIYGQPVAVGDKLSNLFDEAGSDTIKDAMQNYDFKEYVDSDPAIKQIVDMAGKLEGLEKSEGQHACGKVITPEAVVTYLPITYIKEPKGGYGIVTEVTNVEDFGLLKMDFLGLKNLNVLDYAFKSINKEIHDQNKANGTHVPYVNQSTIVKQAIGDMDTYKFLRDRNTFGIFQFSSDGMTDLVHRMFSDVDKLQDNEQTTSELFNRLTAATALYRPGPMQFIDQYIDNMHAKTINYPFPQIKDVVENTYAIIVYQEQVMLISREIAGFSRGASDELRRAMGHKIPELMAEYKQYFLYGSNGKKINGYVIPGAMKYGHLTEDQAKQLWGAIETFASYGFNKSHAVSYTYISIVEAYLSLHYPEEYFSAQLNTLSTNADKVSEALTHINERKISILPPSVNKSDKGFTVTQEDDHKAIRFGLNGIKRSGRKASAIISERNRDGKFTSLVDCGIRLSKAGVWNKTVYEALTYSGAFDEFVGSRDSKINMEEQVLKYIQSVTKKVSFFALKSQRDFIDHLLHFKDGKLSTDDLFREKEFIGYFISGHPISKYYDLVANNPLYTSISSIKNMPEGADFHVIALLDKIRVITTKTFNKMANITFEDQTGIESGLIFTQAYNRDAHVLKEKNIVLIDGSVKVDKEHGRSLLINAVTPIKYLFSKDKPKGFCFVLAFDKKAAKQELEEILKLPDTKAEKKIPFIFQCGKTSLRRYNKTKDHPEGTLNINLDLATVMSVQNIIGRNRIISLY